MIQISIIYPLMIELVRVKMSQVTFVFAFSCFLAFSISDAIENQICQNQEGVEKWTLVVFTLAGSNDQSVS